MEVHCSPVSPWHLKVTEIPRALFLFSTRCWCPLGRVHSCSLKICLSEVGVKRRCPTGSHQRRSWDSHWQIQRPDLRWHLVQWHYSSVAFAHVIFLPVDSFFLVGHICHTGLATVMACISLRLLTHACPSAIGFSLSRGWNCQQLPRSFNLRQQKNMK